MGSEDGTEVVLATLLKTAVAESKWPNPDQVKVLRLRLASKLA